MGIRVSEATYGVVRPRAYDEGDPQHQRRKAIRSVDAEGKTVLMGFCQIVAIVSNVPPSIQHLDHSIPYKDTQVVKMKEFKVRRHAIREVTPLPIASLIEQLGICDELLSERHNNIATLSSYSR